MFRLCSENPGVRIDNTCPDIWIHNIRTRQLQFYIFVFSFFYRGKRELATAYGSGSSTFRRDLSSFRRWTSSPTAYLPGLWFCAARRFAFGFAPPTQKYPSFEAQTGRLVIMRYTNLLTSPNWVCRVFRMTNRLIGALKLGYFRVAKRQRRVPVGRGGADKFGI